MSMYLINVFNFLFGSLIVLTYFSQADDSDDLLHSKYMVDISEINKI